MDRYTIRHLIAAIGYRMAKATHGVPDDFGTFSTEHGARTPGEIVHHMSEVLLMANLALQPGESAEISHADWQTEVEQFYTQLRLVDQAVANRAQPVGMSWEQILQGPLSDALTHIGQLVMLRRLAGYPMAAERYSRAAIREGDIRPC